jgi:hypothetical protein
MSGKNAKLRLLYHASPLVKHPVLLAEFGIGPDSTVESLYIAKRDKLKQHIPQEELDVATATIEEISQRLAACGLKDELISQFLHEFSGAIQLELLPSEIS